MMRLFFFIAMAVSACATSSGATNNKSDDTDRLKALSHFGVTVTGTGYDGDRLVSIQCAVSEGDANLDAKTVRRLAHDDLVKIACGPHLADILAPEQIDFSSAGRVACIKFAVQTGNIKCAGRP